MFCTFKYFKGIQPKIWIVPIGCHSIYITSVIYKYCLLKRSRRLNLIAQEYLCYKVRLVTVFRSLFCDVTILPKFVFFRFGSERGDAAAVWHSVCHSPGVKKLKRYARILRCKKKLSKPRCSTATVKSEKTVTAQASWCRFTIFLNHPRLGGELEEPKVEGAPSVFLFVSLPLLVLLVLTQYQVGQSASSSCDRETVRWKDNWNKVF